MPLEDQLATLTKVVEQGFANLLAVVSNPVRTISAEPLTPTAPVADVKSNGEDKQEIPTFEEVIAIAQKLAAAKGQPVAAKLIQKHGAEKLAQLDKAQYPAFVASATVMLEAVTGDL